MIERPLPRIAFCLVIAACGGDGLERFCTAAACAGAGGLTVNLAQPPMGAYRVEVSVPGNPSVRAQDCSGTRNCLIFFPGFQPDQVHIAIISGSGTTTFDGQVAHVTSFPNGPDCGACTASHIEVP